MSAANLDGSLLGCLDGVREGSAVGCDDGFSDAGVNASGPEEGVIEVATTGDLKIHKTIASTIRKTNISIYYRQSKRLTEKSS